MTQQTPNNNITSAESLDSQQLPGVVFNTTPGGTTNVQMFFNTPDSGEVPAIRGFMAPDAASPRLDEQMQEMIKLGMMNPTAPLALNEGRLQEGIVVDHPPSMGNFTDQLKNQQLAALSQDQNGLS